MASQDRDADPQAAMVPDKAAAVDPFDALLREVAAAPSPPPAPWEMLEQQRYRILGLLGAGGGGQVYKAYDEQLGRNVALKFLNAQGVEQAAQLVKEARTQARVRHPAVCQVYEVVESVGRPFIAMQLIEGPTLSAAAEQLALRDKIGIMRQVAEAVEAAHQLGIVHRDLKPQNIMLERVTDGWHPYVMDFGLAREVDKTLTAGMVGTPHFMAPEQARGDIDAIGPLTDVWALGATLYTLLSGKPPFDGESMMAILRRVETEEPARLPSLPRELQAIVMRCLEKSPAQRYAGAAALARDLGAFERGDPVTARPPGFSRRVLRRAGRHRTLMALAAGAVTVTLAFALLRPAKPWHAAIRELEPSYEETASVVSISPDGKQLVFSSDRGGGFQLYVQSVEGGASRLLRRAGAANTPSWSSDGRALYFIHDSAHFGIERMPSDESSAPVDLFAGQDPVECGGRLFYILRTNDGVDHLRLHERDGSDRELDRSTSDLTDISCTRDGRRLAYVRGTNPPRIVWRDLGDGVEHLLPVLGDGGECPVFHPDGRTIVSEVGSGSRSTLWEQPLDGGPARALTDGGHEVAPAISPDGRLFFNVESDARLVSVHPLDGKPAHYLEATGHWQSLTLTPDGREIITARSTKSGAHEVLAVSVADGTERVLASGNQPTISPDGKQVYFLNLEDEKAVFAVPLEGGPRRVIARTPIPVGFLRAAADALHLGLASDTIRPWRQPYDGTPGADEGSSGLAFIEPAADGWTLAVTANGYAIIVPPGPWPKVLPPETRLVRPRLTVDRRSFIGLDESSEIWLHELATGKERRLARAWIALDLALSRDEKTLYTIDDLHHSRRAELTNYAELPRP